MRRPWLLALLLLLAPSLANAQAFARRRQLSATGGKYLLNGVAANAAVGLRTATFSAVGGYERLTISYSYVRGGTPSALTVTCSQSTDDGTTYTAIPDQVINAGSGTLTDHIWSYATGATGGTTIYLAVNGADSIQCIFSATGGGASDLLTVSAIASAP